MEQDVRAQAVQGIRAGELTVNDTIVATSTPAGRSLRAIVRLSGPDAVAIASAAFESDDPLVRLPTYSSVAGFVVLEAEHIRCPAVAYVMLAPRSYTREDIVELHTFGAPPLLGALSDALMAAGARPAEPGEFTKRAFLNGRIDLTQAEAVQRVIQARSEAELRVSQAQLGGSFKRAIEQLRGRLVGLLAEVEASIDFVGQDIQLIDPSDAAASVGELISDVDSLAVAEPAASPKDGIMTVIAGLPNAGKSSLLNALAGQSRAIVTHIPGTTRDTVEHQAEVGGIMFRLIDTAGVRSTGLEIEEEAMGRAEAAFVSADLTLLIIDGSRPLAAEAEALWRRLTSVRAAAVITIINKSDLPQELSTADEGRLAQRGPILSTSATRGDGLGDLRAEMAKAARSDAVTRSTHAFWLNAWHRAALARAGEALRLARAALAGGPGLEFAAADLHDALTALAEIAGRTTPGDILDTIFSQFCIGK